MGEDESSGSYLSFAFLRMPHNLKMVHPGQML